LDAVAGTSSLLEMPLPVMRFPLPGRLGHAFFPTCIRRQPRHAIHSGFTERYV
jgi:hypothetical protein